MKKRDTTHSTVSISIIVLLVIISLTAVPASAQKMQGSLHLNIASMQGDFKKNVDNIGWGGSASFGYRLADSPVILGGSFGFINYGHETRREPFSTTIPDVTVEVKNSNNIVLFDVSLALEPNTGAVRPYVGFQMGFSYLYTSTKIEEVSGFEEIASDTNFDDFAFNAGAFGGFKFRVWENDEGYADGEHGIMGFFIDLRLDYLYGSKAEYLKEGYIIRGSGSTPVVYDVNSSNTSMLLYKIGIGVEF